MCFWCGLFRTFLTSPAWGLFAISVGKPTDFSSPLLTPSAAGTSISHILWIFSEQFSRNLAPWLSIEVRACENHVCLCFLCSVFYDRFSCFRNSFGPPGCAGSGGRGVPLHGWAKLQGILRVALWGTFVPGELHQSSNLQ